MKSTGDITTLLALSLTLRYFGPNPTLSDARMLIHGRVHLWPEWERDAEARRSVARFLAVRPDYLADDLEFLRRARGVLDQASEFEPVESGTDNRPGWSTAYKMVSGAPLEDRIDGWFRLIEEQGNKSLSPATETRNAGPLTLTAGELSFCIPREHVPDLTAPAPSLHTSRSEDGELIDREALLELAKLIDSQGDGGISVEKYGIRAFFDNFVTKGGLRATLGSPGKTKLAIAPPGTGKSVFARLFALHLARRGVPTALVVPNVQNVWTETLRLQEAADRIGADLSIVPISSWRKLADRLGSYLDQPPGEDPSAKWALRRLGYSCLLTAYSESGMPTPGDEPCIRLRQCDGRSGKERNAGCPFASECGRFSAFRDAITANILVVNHHAFLGGRVPIEISVDGTQNRKLTTAELVFRRAAVVLIDEVDGLQNSAIGLNSSGLALSSRGQISKTYRLLFEIETRLAENRLGKNARFERGRSALTRIAYAAEQLAESINQKEIEWPKRNQMTWHGAQDSWLAHRLFGDQDEGLDRLDSLFKPDSITGDKLSEALRVALRPLGPGLGDGTQISDVQDKIMEALESWPLTGPQSSVQQKDLNRIAHALILRAILANLDQALDHLRPQLVGLEQWGVQQAADLRDDILGYAPWQPSPLGPLGWRLHSYAFDERLDDRGALEMRIMSGDPHGLLRELGGLVSHVLTGSPRVVLGLSATCRFRGSPRADVLGTVVGWVKDDARNVVVHGASVQARISGTSGRSERLEAAREAAVELWNTKLKHYLRRQHSDPETAGRARALLVTGSYDEASAAADALRGVAGTELSIRYLVPDREAAKNQPGAISRAGLESFGHEPAPAVLVGPLNVVSRGHNILQPGSQSSALSGIFVLTRPVPPSHESDQFLAHISYNACLNPAVWQGSPGTTIDAERAIARTRLRALQRSSAVFRYMDDNLRRELICNVLVDLAQLAGRARRGGTPVDMYFVDGAFADDQVPWTGLVSDVLRWWHAKGWLEEMVTLHGAFVAGLCKYAGFDFENDTPGGP